MGKAKGRARAPGPSEELMLLCSGAARCRELTAWSRIARRRSSGSPLTRSGLGTSRVARAADAAPTPASLTGAGREDGKLPLRFSRTTRGALVRLVAVVDGLQLVELRPAFLTSVLEYRHWLSCRLSCLRLNLRQSAQCSRLMAPLLDARTLESDSPFHVRRKSPRRGTLVSSPSNSRSSHSSAKRPLISSFV